VEFSETNQEVQLEKALEHQPASLDNHPIQQQIQIPLEVYSADLNQLLATCSVVVMQATSKVKEDLEEAAVPMLLRRVLVEVYLVEGIIRGVFSVA
jgi:hypothetical protein